MTRDNHTDPEEKYIGNIWGWKFSFISLAIILFFFLLMGMRYTYLKQTGQWDAKKSTIESEK
jgi:hypothetical protein